MLTSEEVGQKSVHESAGTPSVAQSLNFCNFVTKKFFHVAKGIEEDLNRPESVVDTWTDLILDIQRTFGKNISEDAAKNVNMKLQK